MKPITIIAFVVCAFMALAEADHDLNLGILPFFPGRRCTRICPIGHRCVFRRFGGLGFPRQICVPRFPGRKPGRCPFVRPFGIPGWPRRGRWAGRWRRRFCRGRPWLRRCFSDRHCPGILKCCLDRCGRRTCQLPYRWRG